MVAGRARQAPLHFRRWPFKRLKSLLTGGLTPAEVKYHRRIDPFDDTRALRAFLERIINNAPFGLLVTQEDGVQVPDPRIVPISLSAFLWTR